jgi:hypothetical protein
MTRPPILPPSDKPDAALQRLLDTYGADRGRWPAHRIGGAAPVGPPERRAIAEAAALDRVLARAPTVPADREAALAARIMRIAQADPVRTAPTPDNVVPLPSRKAPAPPVQPNLALRPARAAAVRSYGWQAAASLAAALLVGIGLGVGGAGHPGMRSLAEAVGFVHVDQSHADNTVLALNDEAALGLPQGIVDDEEAL